MLAIAPDGVLVRHFLVKCGPFQQGIKRRGTISLNSAMTAILVPNCFASGIKLSSR